MNDSDDRPSRGGKPAPDPAGQERRRPDRDTASNAASDADDEFQAWVDSLRDDRSGTRQSRADMEKLRDEQTLRARLDEVTKALERRRQRRQENERAAASRGLHGSETGKAVILGMRAVSEFIAGIVTGGAIGWLLDKGFSTSPLFLLVFGMLGMVTGFWNVYRAAVMPPRDGRDRKEDDGRDRKADKDG